MNDRPRCAECRREGYYQPGVKVVGHLDQRLDGIERKVDGLRRLIDAAEKYAFSSEARPALDVERLDEALHNIYERRYGAIETGAPPVTVFGEIAAGIAAEYARLAVAEAASDE